MGVENHDQIMKDIESLALEKYTEEIVSACIEGATKCKNDKDAWSTVEVRIVGYLWGVLFRDVSFLLF